MGTWREELRPYDGEPSASAGWRLAKAGWRLLRRDRTVAALTLLVALVLALPFLASALGDGLDPWDLGGGGLVTRLGVAALATGLVSFLLVALASAVDGAVDGLPLDLREALGDARRRLGAIVAWAALSVATWAALVLLADAVSASWLTAPAAVAWYAATLFVIPAIAIDGRGALAALAESLRLFAAAWRSAAAGLAGIAACAAVALIAPGTMLSHAAAVHREGNGTDLPLLIGGLALLILVAALALATREAFAVLALRAALDDLPAGEYTGRRLRRRAKVARFAGAAAVVLIALAVIGAATRGDRETLDASRAPGANYTTLASNPDGIDLPSGAAVLYRGEKVGIVLGSHEEDGELSVTFHVDPGIGPGTTPGSFRVVVVGALGPTLVLIPAAGESGGGEAQPF